MFNEYAEYLAFLKNRPMTLKDLQRVDWKNTLPETLGEPYDVFVPRQPNPTNARYIEWKIWFEKFVPEFVEGVVFVGHSLGGIFLAKYLAEEKFPIAIGATMLVAPPFLDKDAPRKADWLLPASLDGVVQQGGRVFLYHSKDDTSCAFADSEKYARALSGVIFRAFEDRGHFKQETFSELVEDIRALGM